MAYQCVKVDQLFEITVLWPLIKTKSMAWFFKTLHKLSEMLKPTQENLAMTKVVALHNPSAVQGILFISDCTIRFLG